MHVLTLVAIWLAAAAAPAQATAPATAPAERQWGQTNAGLSVSAAPVGRWLLARRMDVDFAIRNTGKLPATLPPADDLFGYLLLAQGKTAHYTEKIFHARGQPGWPARLAEGQVLQLRAVDVSELKAFAYNPRLPLVKGYPLETVGGQPRPAAPAGSVGEVLKPGPVRVKYVAYLPRPGEGAVSLVSSTIRVDLGLADFGKLPADRQRRILDDLAARLKKDAWSAKLAHGDAVQIGRPAAATLISIAADTEAPYFGRMWAVAALADIGGQEAAAALIACLGDADPGVRCAAAYHGLKLRSEPFDKALNQRAVSAEDAGLSAWAIMGYLKFRKQVPPELLKAGVESDEWRVRAAVAETLARGNPDRSHLPILRRLAQDSNPQIRRTAARAIGYVGDRCFETIAALIAALPMQGEDARHSVAGALSALTGKKWPYDQSASLEEKAVIVSQWQRWWEMNKASYRKSEPPK
ncbi:MAG: hypothetical protein AMJ81_08885 [Phycisphaerae bacterium SM23_33]|nr:MAG: hypothetical protein AMJ81_08885 [Phycisphaerae bacterium SM23_33]